MDEILGLDRRALDRARISRDRRFDGRFFIAVTSTGIYCRPVCPSPSSKSCNVRYYTTAAAAEEAGFRPCLRCRPEAAPGTPAWHGTSAVVRRALQLIHDGALDGASVDALAARLGIGTRHLHRLFVQHVGASPLAVAQTRRLHFAKRLLDETDLPITQIAMASGFRSLRRFNEAFQGSYRRSPRELRKLRRGGLAIDGGDDVILKLAFRPPYDWAQVRDCLAARAVPGVERVDAQGYARTAASDGGPALVRVRPLDGEDALELRVCGAAPAALFGLCAAARRTFDLAADPARIGLAFKSDPLLGPLVRARPGLRIPGAWDPFECAVRAVLGAGTLAARLVARVGRPIRGGADGLTHLFPSPAAVAAADLDGLGIPSARIAALHALARAAADGTLELDASLDEVTAALSRLPGFGARTAQYVALRAFGEPDAFPAADPVLQRMASASGARALETRAEVWRPWRGYAALHLWRAADGRLRPAGSGRPSGSAWRTGRTPPRSPGRSRRRRTSGTP